MELSQSNPGPTGQVDQNKLFEQFFNSDSQDYNSLLATPPAPAAEVETTEPQTPTEVTPSGEQAAEQNEVAAESQPPSQPDPNSWLTSLPDDVRANVERIAKEAQLWQQRHTEQASKNRRMNNELLQLRQMVEAPKAAPVAETDEADDVWAQLKEADPILHAALEKKLGALERKVLKESEHKVQERFQPIEQERNEYFVQEQLQTLDHVVPNWREVTQAPEYQSWFDAQTPGTKALYNSPYAVDSIRLLKLYADDMERYFGSQQQVAQPQQPVNTQAQALDQARQQKLERSAPVQAPTVGTAKQQQLTQQQMFDKFYGDDDASATLLAMLAKRS